MKIMKNKILTGIMLLLALVVASCNDDDYSANTADIITTIETGSAEAGATSASVSGTVLDLSKAAASSYNVGVAYSTSEDPTSGTKVPGTLAENGTVTATLSGLIINKTYYYCTYVTLQGKVTKYGDVKSFVTTNAEIATADAAFTEVTANLSGTINIATAASDVVVKGILVSTDEAKVKSGRLYKASADTEGNVISIPLSGLVPGQTYYYVAYTKVNSEEKYGEVKSFTTKAQNVEFVDLGLSVEWATVNVGALNPEEAGGLYGFGDKSLFNISTQAADYTHEDIQGGENDLASLFIPGAFTPSKEQMEELLNNTTAEYAQVNGVNGYRFTAANGNSIFMPVTGSRTGETVSGEGTLGAYWTANIDAVDADHASALSFNEGTVHVSSANLYEGLAIRPVRTPNRPMKLEYLYKTWCIDLDADAKSAVWKGPQYYYGMDDSWNTVTNGYKLPKGSDSWIFDPTYADATWLTTPKNFGTMTFKEDGTVIVDDKGNGKHYEGTFTVDTEKHTITLKDAQILHLDNFDNLVSNWSTELKVLSLTEDGLQIAGVRDQNTDEGKCLLAQNYVNAALVGGNGKDLAIDNSKLVYGDLESKGNLRLELYNEYGSKSPCYEQSALTFTKTMAVTFKLSGVQLKEGAVGQYNASLSYASSDWGVQYWGGTAKQDALVNGDGTYTVWLTGEQANAGATVFCVDIAGLANDVVDMSAVKAEIVSITTDMDESKLAQIIPVDNSKVLFNNKDGNGTDGRVEIYNEYGETKNDPGVSQSDISFNGRMCITFTITGIDGNLKSDATADYKAELSYAAASWSPSYWGGGIGKAQVTKDGTYTVYADMGNDDCTGAVVWAIELYNLWKDLVDTSKVKVSIDEVAVEPIKK